ncbi:hypothetical protein [Halorientalis halophila]|uniref:hypothetical protein n=1 Tax=Halorientalis halophila TaxID=3108499 RepID=UPI00300AC243
MGLTAIVSSSASSASSSAASASASATSLTSPVGLGVGGIFVAAALVLLLAYLDLLDASRFENPRLRRSLVATVLPLGMAFGGVVVYESLQLI